MMLRQLIRVWMKSEGMGLRPAARAIGVPAHTLRRFLVGRPVAQSAFLKILEWVGK